jgi:hypothetical protein
MSNYCCICIDIIETKNCKVEDNIEDSVEIKEVAPLYFLNCCNNKIHKSCLLEWVMCKGLISCPLCRSDPSCIKIDDLLTFTGYIDYNHLNFIVNKLVGNNFYVKIISNEEIALNTESRNDVNRNSTFKFYSEHIFYIIFLLFLVLLFLKYKITDPNL